MAEQLDWETIAKRMIAASHYGISICYADGHRWAYVSDVDEGYFKSALKKAGIYIRNKQYGGLLSVLDAADIALKHIKWPSLIETYNQLTDGGDYEENVFSGAEYYPVKPGDVCHLATHENI